MFDAQVAEIDAFIAEAKTLDGLFPHWTQHYGKDFQARWGILNSLGIRRGELAFSLDWTGGRPSVVAVIEQNPIYRLDLVPENECEPNPPNSYVYGLAAEVCGPHHHSWQNNREYVRIKGFKELPYRSAVGGLRELTLTQALAIAADELNITVSPMQRDCPLPPQPGFFGDGM